MTLKHLNKENSKNNK